MRLNKFDTFMKYFLPVWFIVCLLFTVFGKCSLLSGMYGMIVSVIGIGLLKEIERN